MQTIEWPSGDLPYYMAFAQSGQILEPMTLSENHAREVAKSWKRRKHEDAVAVEYRYDRSADRSVWFRNVYDSSKWRS